MGYPTDVPIGVPLYCSIWTSVWNILISYFIYSVVKAMEFGLQFLMGLFYNEDLSYLLRSCTNLIVWTIFVPQTWTKIFSVSQIAAFFNKPYVQNKLMK